MQNPFTPINSTSPYKHMELTPWYVHKWIADLAKDFEKRKEVERLMHNVAYALRSKTLKLTESAAIAGD